MDVFEMRLLVPRTACVERAVLGQVEIEVDRLVRLEIAEIGFSELSERLECLHEHVGLRDLAGQQEGQRFLAALVGR